MIQMKVLHFFSEKDLLVLLRVNKLWAALATDCLHIRRGIPIGR